MFTYTKYDNDLHMIQGSKSKKIYNNTCVCNKLRHGPKLCRLNDNKCIKLHFYRLCLHLGSCIEYNHVCICNTDRRVKPIIGKCRAKNHVKHTVFVK